MYALTHNLGRSAKSVAVKRYSAQMKGTGTFGDEALQGDTTARAGFENRKLKVAVKS